MINQTLTVSRLKELLVYCPDSGEFTWRESRGRVKAGSIAGSAREDGYIRIFIDGHNYRAHRLAWMYVHGVWPVGEIDHKHGITSDNRISELRETNRAANQQNMRKARCDNQSGFLGVSPSQSGSGWIASIQANGKKSVIGKYPTPLEAHNAYLCEKRKRHSGCTI